MYTLTAYEEELCKEIVDCAFRVDSQPGPGLLEKVYEACFCHELSKRTFLISARPTYQFSMMDWYLMKVCAWMFLLKVCYFRIESS